ncbi:MAG: PTS sugar transporter subunit IIA [Balneolaceae bacterium]
MNIYSLLSENTIIPDLTVQDKDDLLNRLVDLLENQISEEQLESVRKAVFEREAIMSTGVGKGLAIPHGKAAGIDSSHASFAILSEPVDYESIDGKPVRIVFLLVGPESKNSIHIKLLSRISRLMNSSAFRKRLFDCRKPDEVLDQFRREEQRSFNT